MHKVPLSLHVSSSPPGPELYGDNLHDVLLFPSFYLFIFFFVMYSTRQWLLPLFCSMRKGNGTGLAERLRWRKYDATATPHTRDGGG